MVVTVVVEVVGADKDASMLLKVLIVGFQDHAVAPESWQEPVLYTGEQAGGKSSGIRSDERSGVEPVESNMNNVKEHPGQTAFATTQPARKKQTITKKR